jgi:hypothetical protein
MDTNTAILIALLVLALVAIIALILFRQRASAEIDTPLGKLRVQGDNTTAAAPTPGAATVEQAQSGGNITAAARTGGNATVRDAKAKGDTAATTENPTPKADPPA